MNDKSTTGFLHLTPLEFAAGWAPGHLTSRRAPGGQSMNPISALEGILLPALEADPCAIGFSGGRDSSALLAIAVRLARRLGLEDPVPVTNRFPGIPEAEESNWQELVIRHLQIKEWVRRDVSFELDMLGTPVKDSLRRFGLLWPATLHNRAFTVSIARGGYYVDGEGGDEILGEFRMTPIAQLLRRQRPVNLDAVRKSMHALSPRVIRRAFELRRMTANHNRSWLRPDAADWYLRTAAQDEAFLPIRYSRAVERVAARRVVKVAMTNLDTMGQALGVQYVHPLLDPRFVDALGRWAPVFGYTSRTETMRALFHGVLPDAILARNQKAYFNHAFVQAETRQFLERWDGTGLDPELIDSEELHALWNQPRINGGTFHLIHAAWMAQHADDRSGH